MAIFCKSFINFYRCIFRENYCCQLYFNGYGTSARIFQKANCEDKVILSYRIVFPTDNFWDPVEYTLCTIYFIFTFLIKKNLQIKSQISLPQIFSAKG